MASLRVGSYDSELDRLVLKGVGLIRDGIMHLLGHYLPLSYIGS